MPSRSLRWSKVNNNIYHYRKGRTAFGVLIICSVILTIGMALWVYLSNLARNIPSVDMVLSMKDEEASSSLNGVSGKTICEVWGEPWYTIEIVYSEAEERYSLIYKEEDGIDYVKLVLAKETDRIVAVEVWQVFKAYPVYCNNDYSWGTVQPCENEDESGLGDLIRINLRTSRPAVLDYLDPTIPVIIYYKGIPHTDEQSSIPYIDMVMDIQFYDNILEPITSEKDS